MAGDAAMIGWRSDQPRHCRADPCRQLLDRHVLLLDEDQLLGDVSELDIRITERLFVPGKPTAKMWRQLTLARDTRLERVPVRRKAFGGLRPWRRHNVGDLRQRHIETTQHDDQPGGGELTLAIATIAVVGIDVGRSQQSEAVVEA
jgi:hypothetical protein